MSVNSSVLSDPDKSTQEQLRVLVVDDSKMQRKLVSAHLKKWGFVIFEAESGKSALELCKHQSIDLVLSDWVMPEMDGLEFCKKFRELPRDRYGYFILLTSKSEKGDVAAGLDVGADDFLSKPVNSHELRARIQAGQRVLEMEQQLQIQNTKVTAALSELQIVYDAIKKDLTEAEKLQKSLIPERFSEIEGANLSNLFKSCGHVGGDLVGHFELGKDRRALFSLDVSGHGVSSALLTIRLAGFFNPQDKERNVAFRKNNAGQFVPQLPNIIAEKMNAQMLGELDTELYFTLAFADVNLATGHVKMVQAGHPHPAIINPETGVRYVGSGGPPIGLIDALKFETFEFDLTQGEKLLLYSDGLTECENPQGEMLDEDGLERILMKHGDSHGTELLDDIVWDLTEFANGDQFGDDLSAILLEFSGKTKQ